MADAKHTLAWEKREDGDEHFIATLPDGTGIEVRQSGWGRRRWEAVRHHGGEAYEYLCGMDGSGSYRGAVKKYLTAKNAIVAAERRWCAAIAKAKGAA